ncbi:hypothetical protein GSI_06874 [Ganoderma sinense ZZ0214-1]|uniref:Uncharacterized protein n=1 Tax=Ganoderma sinense ZZ0214-1 TaxID=1077348 RepID=A0A2G8SAC1_9APHY|nr:hypothetical protein GSI_06874 [Ganoderma sinense ZZ0214-1]
MSFMYASSSSFLSALRRSFASLSIRFCSSFSVCEWNDRTALPRRVMRSCAERPTAMTSRPCAQMTPSCSMCFCFARRSRSARCLRSAISVERMSRSCTLRVLRKSERLRGSSVPCIRRSATEARSCRCLSTTRSAFSSIRARSLPCVAGGG